MSVGWSSSHAALHSRPKQCKHVLDFSWNLSWNLLEICSVKFVDTLLQWQTGYSPRPPTSSDKNTIWYGGWSSSSSYKCQVSSTSAQRLPSCEGSKFGWSLLRPMSYRTAIFLYSRDPHAHVLWPSGLCPGLPGWFSTRTNLDFTKARDSEQQCKFVPCPRHNHASTS